MAPGRLTIRLAPALLLAMLTGCSNWRIGEPSLNHSQAQGQITGPAPAVITFTAPEGEGSGTVTPLEDGTLLTAAHVLHGAVPLQLDWEDIRSLDIVRSGRGESDTAEVHAGDWIELRAEPSDARGWRVSTRRPEVGEYVIIRGFTQPFDAAGRPLLREVRVRLREAPWWIRDADRHLLYAVRPGSDGRIDFHGMSGGPVLLKDAATGVETLVGIYSGAMTGKWLFFRKRVWVIEPWPQ